ncbi:hypothetical protein JNK62_04740 [bacterium]|nr:hypothetical protein [bacterium]
MARTFEDIFLGNGYLHIHDADISTLHLKHGPGTSFMLGIHVPHGIMHAFGELRVVPMLSRGGYLAGERLSLGEGAIAPSDRGIRLYDREETARSRLNISLIRSLMKADARVSMSFRVYIQ